MQQAKQHSNEDTLLPDEVRPYINLQIGGWLEADEVWASTGNDFSYPTKDGRRMGEDVDVFLRVWHKWDEITFALTVGDRLVDSFSVPALHTSREDLHSYLQEAFLEDDGASDPIGWLVWEAAVEEFRTNLPFRAAPHLFG